MRGIRLAVTLFSLLLLITIISLALSYRASTADWILLHNPRTQAVSVFDVENDDTVRLRVLPMRDLRVFRVSPNGKWLYVFDSQGTVWGANLVSGEFKTVFQNRPGGNALLQPVSPDGSLLFFGEDDVIKRFDLNTATDTTIDKSMMQQYDLPDDPQFWWLESGDWVYIRSRGRLTHRISRDGTMIEENNAFQTTTSPDGNWMWYRDDDDVVVENLDDHARYTVPSRQTRSRSILGWTPDNTLLIRYTDAVNAEFHNELVHSPTTLVAFQDGRWTTISEGKVAFNRPPGQFSSISPAHTHYLYFDDDDQMYVMDLITRETRRIGGASQFYYWNETSEWLAYIRIEDRRTLTVAHYDIATGATTDLHTFDWNGDNFGFQTLAGTSFVVLDWLGPDASGDMLIDVETGRVHGFAPGTDVVSTWYQPDFDEPSYGLHVVVGLVLLGVSLISFGICRNLAN